MTKRMTRSEKNLKKEIKIILKRKADEAKLESKREKMLEQRIKKILYGKPKSVKRKAVKRKPVKGKVAKRKKKSVRKK